MNREEAEALYDKGLESIHIEDFEDALVIARQLNNIRYSGGFEIEALAHAGRGNSKNAIRTLKKAVKKCPDVWVLWQLLGNCLSDDEQFGKAVEAFDIGLLTSEPNSASLKLNKSIALERMGKLIEARSTIRPLLDNARLEELELRLQARVLTQEFGLLNTLGQPEDTKRQFEALGNRDFGDEAGTELSMLWCQYAEALQMLGEHKDAEQAALQAILYDNRWENAQWWLREIRRSGELPQINLYHIILEGSDVGSFGRDVAECEGYFVSYSVAAESEEEAFKLALEFEPPATRDFLKIDSIAITQDTHDPKGVYVAYGYNFFGDHEE